MAEQSSPAAGLLTLTAYARMRGCAKSAVSKAVSEGRITLTNGKIDPLQADKQWSENGRARADSKPAVGQPESGDPNEITYASSRARREHAEAQRAEMDLKRMSGRLVDREKVERAVFDLFRLLRDKAMGAAPRAARKAAGATDVREIEIAITDELRAAFDEFERRASERLTAEALGA